MHLLFSAYQVLLFPSNSLALDKSRIPQRGGVEIPIRQIEMSDRPDPGQARLLSCSGIGHVVNCGDHIGKSKEKRSFCFFRNTECGEPRRLQKLYKTVLGQKTIISTYQPSLLVSSCTRQQVGGIEFQQS